MRRVHIDESKLRAAVRAKLSRPEMAVFFGVHLRVIDRRLFEYGIRSSGKPGTKPSVQIREIRQDIAYSHPRTTLASHPFSHRL